MRVFKVQNGKGEFNTGGGVFRTTKLGKVWGQRGHALNHLRCVLACKRGLPEDWDLVEYELVEVKRTSVKELFSEEDPGN